MVNIWDAAESGDLAEVQRLVGEDPGLLEAQEDWPLGGTPLMFASKGGHVGVVRWLLDEGAAINAQSECGYTAVWWASCKGHLSVVRLLLERGANPTFQEEEGSTPLLRASSEGHLEVVRLLLGHARAKATLNHRDYERRTALYEACFYGRGAVARALLENGADPTIGDHNGITPMTVAKRDPPSIPRGITAEGRRECVIALEVRAPFSFHSLF
jgi:ankyrin repeat protein